MPKIPTTPEERKLLEKHNIPKSTFFARVHVMKWDRYKACTKPAHKKNPDKEYALYKGDELVTIGTVAEIARARGVKEESVLYLKTPSSMKRNNGGKRMVLVDLDEE